MGLPLARLVAACLALASAWGLEVQRVGQSRSHSHNVCSTWGNFHYKTFDGDIFRFPGLCDYNFASDCRDSYKEFAVHLKRSPGQDGSHPQVESVLLTVKDDTIYLTRQLVVVNGAMVSTPHYSAGLLIVKSDAYTKIYSRAGLSLMWNREDALMLELDSRFHNHTCGLCGDYNGLQTYSEFLSEGISFSAIEFGNMQKINKPEEECEDPEEAGLPESCSQHRAECERLLTAEAFEDCQARVPLELYVEACMHDRCQCLQADGCVCSTIAEFSRQCSHAGGRPGNWRTASFCAKSCPGNMVYLESGSPCMDTCSHLEVSNLCEEHHMDGCFCPEGTVYDDITGSGCVPVSQCYCKLHGHLHAPGQEVTNDCEQCVCNAGRWVCKDLSCPGTCSLEGGSHITTFDGKKFTFHGDCDYVLAKGDHNDSYALLGELAPCGTTDKQTCLKTVQLLTDSRKNVVAFKSDGSVLLNELQVTLPHVAASFSIFRPSSYHIVVNTVLGLQLQVQLVPVMQLFVTLDPSAQGQVQGLCGNFNGLESDDFKTSSGLVEATGASFANSWKAQPSCHDKLDWLDDPCSLNIESANYAEHWCSLLKKTETPFGRCHLAVDPTEYYKRCKYDTCNCQNNEDCLCAALSSYAHACAAKGVLLWGWREHVCNKDVNACPSSQIFLYNLTTCQQTCRSLSEGDTHCLKGFAPVDGCGCPDHTFLDQKGRCVPRAKCSCHHHGFYLEAGEVILRQSERCICQDGRLNCRPIQLIGQSCKAPKILVDCNDVTSLAPREPRPISCQTLVAGYYHTGCVSGCVCPNGLLDDGRGGCVEEEECPCVHSKALYPPGHKIKLDCNNTCTCQSGRWECTKFVCHGTCSIYGSGHYVTFDGRHYDFDGHCSYVAVQDYCGQNSTGSFSIVTENVPCGTTGVTCSKSIKIFIGRMELKLEDKHHKVIQLEEGQRVAFTTREVGQYLVVEASTGVIVIWDKKTTVFIKLAPSYKGSVCGLCGNFDDRTSNDFTTRDHMVVSSELDFGNSWKEASTCPDVAATPDPCSLNPHRRSWAEKQCSIIKSSVFAVCHSKVDPTVFYEACVHDSCSCDSGGDCECFCSAVASYAQECTKAEACVFWRTPDLCRCYPRCPKDKPIYDEDLKLCVTGDRCGCYVEDTHYPPGTSLPTNDICKICECNNFSQVNCSWDVGKVLNSTQDGLFCYNVTCGPNGTVHEDFNVCPSTTLTPSTTPRPSTLTTSTSVPTTPTTPLTTTSAPSTTTGWSCCFWSDWINEDHPSKGTDGGDRETFDSVCSAPEDIECRSATDPHLSLQELGQKPTTPTPITYTTETTTPTTTTTTTTETTTPTPTTTTETRPTPTTTTETTTPTPTGTTTETTTPTTTTTETTTPTPTITTTVTTTPTPETSTPTLRTTTPTPMTTTTETTTTPETTTPTPTTTTETTTPTYTTTTETTTPTPTETTTPTPTTTTETTPTTSTTTVTTTPTPETTTPTSIPTTTETTTLTVPTTTAVTSTQTSLSSTEPTISDTTPIETPSSGWTYSPSVLCCFLNGTYYLPGELVYNGTHGNTCYYVNCSLDCELQFFNWSCPSTPSTSTPTPSTSTPTPSTSTPTSSSSTPTPTPSKPTSSTPVTTKPPGCLDFIPPRQENETWWLCNCTMATCKYDNVVEIIPVECKPPPKPTCSNGLKPVQVMDPDGCCWHWECDCYCTGWGDPHFVTFDGLYYSYQGNCTYVLVEEITSTVDNFGVYVDNYHCDIHDKVSCPRTLIVRHETQEVLIKTLQMTPMKVQVLINKQAVALPYKKYGLKVYESGINFLVDIPELGALISYNGLSFSIRLPYKRFGNNTKGQCGTCTNSTEDDCVLPNGEVTSNCELAADQWVVNDPSKPHCPHTDFTTKRPVVKTTPPDNCTQSPICQLIKDSLFAQCHALVPPQHYYEACIFDSCSVPNSGMECASVQAYAALCSQEGFCVDWRRHTNGSCAVMCPAHREYQACGPAEEPTCTSSSPLNSSVLVEGCFCPEGTTNYAPGYDVCVKMCGCVGPDSVPREFGEHFVFDCKDCICLEGGSGITCQPKKCSQEALPMCKEEGTYLVTEVNPADTCCNISSCKCNASLCKSEPPSCSLGFEAKSKMVPGQCCPVYSCEPKRVCVHNSAEYQPGSPVYSSKCQDCLCSHEVNNSTQLNIISCTPVPCNVSCDPGFEPVEVPGECCRKCQQTSCIISMPSGQRVILKPGDVEKNPNNKCTFFSCVEIHNQLISSVSNITCPDFDPSSCVPGSITFMPNECCQTCIPLNTSVPCATVPIVKEISHAGCAKNVTTNYCSGSCETFSMYSAKAQTLDHRCSCCKEESTVKRQVVLDCPNGGSLDYTYTHIQRCRCRDSVCGLPQA
ncbi:mucin-2 [Octodon degus]|uniref:Mucin-2 n=1 Tax=Octodon degus TaxID=10160 RepID=A0A6P3F3P2_OCTDE|nr:mucin-2 [Octodon degus]